MVIFGLKKLTKKRLSPNANYIIWVVLIVAFIFPVSLPSRISIYNYIDIHDFKIANHDNKMINFIEEMSNNNEFSENLEEEIHNNFSKVWKHYVGILLIAIWFIVFMKKIIQQTFSYLYFLKSIGNNVITDKRVNLILERCKKKLKIRKHIKIIKQDSLSSPATIGIFNIRILLTSEFLEFNDTDLTNIFRHELAHYKRKDNFINLLLLIIKSIFWFHPMMKTVFERVRNEMEFATDEVAIEGMNFEEQRDYCKLMVSVAAGMNGLETEHILGLSTNSELIEERINMIALKEDFEKKSGIIAIATAVIILLMCFIFYPTSYGTLEFPKLYLELENGNRIEVNNVEDERIQEVTLSTDSEVELVAKGRELEDYVFYHKVDLDTMESDEAIYNITSDKIWYFETGEYMYKFMLGYGNRKIASYAIKIIVEER